jgi:hypothetical protein
VAGTPVLMADGSSKPIEQVRAGDRVLARDDADPSAGTAHARTVRTVINGEGGKDLVELTAGGGKLTATAGHPFWLPREHRWAEADQLHAGQWLQTAAGTWVQIGAVERHTAELRVYNLVVDEDHTYFVLVGHYSALVHNCRGVTLNLTFMPGWSPRQVAAARAKVAALNRADRLVVTKVNRGSSARSVWERAGRSAGDDVDVDHIIDLQLGGTDELGNMRLLNSSVNRSLGSQVSRRIKSLGLEPGTVIRRITIGPR